MTNSTQSSNVKTYDIHTTGFGFVNRIREVFPDNGKPYLACDLALREGVAKDGNYDNINTTYFNANIVGTKAIELIREHCTVNGKVVAPQQAVASVLIAGITPNTFVFKKGERLGQTGVSLKTRLLKITYLKINGQEIDLGNEETGETQTKSEMPNETTQDDQATAESDDTNNTGVVVNPDDAKAHVEATAQTIEEVAEEERIGAVETLAELNSDDKLQDYEPSAAEQAAYNTQPVSVANATAASESAVAQEVKLDKEDPEFEAKKSKLKELGYKWNTKATAWQLPVAAAAAAAA